MIIYYSHIYAIYSHSVDYNYHIEENANYYHIPVVSDSLWKITKLQSYKYALSISE